MKRMLLSLAAVAVSLGLSGAAYAATSTSSIAVSVSILPACSVTATPVSFSNWPGRTQLANGSINVTCASGTPYSIAVDGGLHHVGAARNVSDGVNAMNYGLYRDAALTSEFGDGVTHTAGAAITGQLGSGATQALTVYGKILPGVSLPPAGLYTDTVTVTVTY